MTGVAGLFAFALLAPSTDLECRANMIGVREIRSVASGIVAADNRRDLKQVLAYYAADAILLPPGEAAVVGRDRIRPRYEALFASFTPEIELRIDEACVGAALGFVRGHNGGRLVSRASGETRLLDDAFLMVLRLESAGEWRISHLIWHRQGQAEPRRLEE
jgi:ketosteroid isomerase-like protein